MSYLGTSRNANRHASPLAPSPRLGSLLRRGGGPTGSGRANVFTPAGGLTGRPAAASTQIRSDRAGGRTQAPIRGDPSTPPLEKGRPSGADGGYEWVRLGQRNWLLRRGHVLRVTWPRPSVWRSGEGVRLTRTSRPLFFHSVHWHCRFAVHTLVGWC